MQSNQDIEIFGCPCGFVTTAYDGFITNDEEKGRKIRTEIATETNCVCVENNKTGEWFLALTGGGMDLSFSIAHAYMIAQKWLPVDLLNQLSPGWCKDNLNDKVFKKLRRICREQINMEISKLKEKKQKWAIPVEKIVQ